MPAISSGIVGPGRFGELVLIAELLGAEGLPMRDGVADLDAQVLLGEPVDQHLVRVRRVGPPPSRMRGTSISVNSAGSGPANTPRS